MTYLPLIASATFDLKVKSPMLACSTQPDLDKLTYPLYASFKLDGIRCLIQRGKAVSRKFKDIPNKHIQKVLSKLPYALDGELMVKGTFNDVDSAVMSFEGEPDFTFMVFDILNSPKPFCARYEELLNIFKDKPKDINIPIKLVYQHICESAEEVRSFYTIAIDQGYEGLILRSSHGLYKEGRSTLKQEWMLKVKPVCDTEATIVDCTELMRNENDPEINNVGLTERNKRQEGLSGGNTLGALICKDSEGIEVKVGSGFTASQRQDIWDHFDHYKGKIITFKYQDRTPDNAYRFPVFKGFRRD